MLRIALIGMLFLLAHAGGARASHPMEPAFPDSTRPADRIALPGFAATDKYPPTLVPAVVGDVDGDGLDDVAAAFPRGGRAEPIHVVFTRPPGATGPEQAGLRRGFRIVGTSWSAAAVGVGDLDRDGLDDIAVAQGDHLVVVFGKSTGGDVDLGALGERGMRIHGANVWDWSSGAETPQIVNVGDQNGDGLDDLAFAAGTAVKLVYTPPSPAGAVVDATTLEPADGVLMTTDGGWPPRIGSLGQAFGDGRDDLVVAWHKPDGSGAHVAAIGLTGGGAGPIDLTTVAETDRGWELIGSGVFIDSLLTLGERPGAQARVPLIGVGGRTWMPGALQPGDQRALTDPGFHSIGVPLWNAVDAGDQDLDGRSDVLTSSGIEYVFERSEYPGGVYFPNVEGMSRQAAGTLRDVDGDGMREVVFAHSGVETPDGPGGEYRGRWQLDVHHSSSWPHDHDPRRFAPAPCCSPSEGAWPPPPPPSWLVPWGPPRPPLGRGGLGDISETPAYGNGTVVVTIRMPRDSAAVGRATATGWRPGSPVWELPEASGKAGGHPWVKLVFALPPQTREAIEADGRLRLNVNVDATWNGRAVRPQTMPIVVVTRPRPAPFGVRRRLRGSFGVQRLLGGPLADLITGASADDVLRGGGGPDALHGGTGDDTLSGDDGGDLLDGDDGDDRLYGGAGADQLVELRFGDDRLDGGPGDDFVSGGRGVDTLAGGPGDDVLAGGSGPDVVACGDGEDVVFVNFRAERKRTSGCEHVYEEPGVIHMPCADGGTDLSETLLGTEGDDRCEGRDGADDLEGRGGDDVLVGGGGADRAFGRFGNDLLDGGAGADELEGGRGRDVLWGGAGDDRLNGGYDADAIAAGPGADRIIARGGGADRIDCGAGVDTVYADSRDTLRGCERVRRSGG